MKRRVITKSFLKAKMYEWFCVLRGSGGSIIVTDFGKPVLEIVPYSEKITIDKAFTDLRGRCRLPCQVVLHNTEAEWKRKL